MFAISLSYGRLLSQWGPFNCRVIDSLSKTDLSLFAVCLSVSEFKRVSLVAYTIIMSSLSLIPLPNNCNKKLWVYFGFIKSRSCVMPWHHLSAATQSIGGESYCSLSLVETLQHKLISNVLVPVAEDRL